MRFETKLGLITIVLLGSTFSFLLYQKIQERKATLANQVPTSPDSNYVNVETTDEKKSVKEINTKEPISVIKKKAENKPSESIVQKVTPKPKFNWEVKPSGKTSFAQNEIKTNTPPAKWNPAPKEQKQLTNPFNEKASKKAFGNSFAAQKTIEKKNNFEIKPLEKKPVKKTDKPSFDFVQKAPDSKPIVTNPIATKTDKKLANPFSQNQIPDDPINIEQKKTPNIVMDQKPKIEVANDPFNTPVQKEIKKQPAIVQKKIEQKPAFDFASSGNADPFKVPVEKKQPEIQIPNEFTKQTPIAKKTEIKKPAFPVDPFAPSQKKPEVNISQNNDTQNNMAQKEVKPQIEQKAVDLFDNFVQKKEEKKNQNIWQSEPKKAQPKVVQKELFTPNYHEPPRLDVIQSEKPLISENKPQQNKIIEQKPISKIEQKPIQPKLLELKPVRNHYQKQITNQKPINASPFAPLIDQKDPLEGLKELPPTRKLKIAKAQNAQFISMLRSIPAKIPARVHVAQAGDSYWKISKRRYGSAMYFAALGEFNKERIKDPNRLKPGMKVLIPSAQTLESKYPQFFKSHIATSKNTAIQLVSSDNSAGFYVTNDGQPMYRVGHEDTLTSIAKSHLGRTARWTEIFEMNKSRIKNANRLKLGTELILPSDASRISVLNSSPLYQ